MAPFEPPMTRPLLKGPLKPPPKPSLFTQARSNTLPKPKRDSRDLPKAKDEKVVEIVEVTEINSLAVPQPFLSSTATDRR